MDIGRVPGFSEDTLSTVSLTRLHWTVHHSSFSCIEKKGVRRSLATRKEECGSQVPSVSLVNSVDLKFQPET